MNGTISYNLKRLREASGYTQRQVARVLGIKCYDYRKYETGDREMPYDMIESASDFYGCDMSLFFEDNIIRKAHIGASSFSLDDLTIEDINEIIRFNDIVKSYLKMVALDEN